MPTISFVSVEDFEALKAEIRELRILVADFLEGLDDEVRTEVALKITGIGSRTTLMIERDRPGTLISYTRNGRSISYSRLSCIAYRRARRGKQ